ncbi:hypothetical protein ACG83_09035 [Frankia sp. R43]|nr:hypothetical protein ACG83_09035 [Frankia sp. R43]
MFQTSYSATDWLIRRCRIAEARGPSTLIGSFHASSATPACSSRRSIARFSYIRRAIRDIDSQITASNRQFG